MDGKQVKEKSYDDLMQDLCTRADSLTHLTAKAEMERRAALQARRNGHYMLASVIFASIPALHRRSRRISHTLAHYDLLAFLDRNSTQAPCCPMPPHWTQRLRQQVDVEERRSQRGVHFPGKTS
jgi:hypothetical protein